MIKASVKKNDEYIDLVIETAPLLVVPPHWPIFNKIFIYFNTEGFDGKKQGISVKEYTVHSNPLLLRLQDIWQPLLLKTYTPVEVTEDAEKIYESYLEAENKRKPVYSIKLSPRNFIEVIDNAQKFEDIVKKGFVTVDQVVGSIDSMPSKEDLFCVDSKEYNKYKTKLTELEEFLDKFVQSMLYFEKARDVEGEDIKLSKQNSRQGYKLLKELFS